MAFNSDFEQLLDEYNIDVSERTRRLIRRNNGKTPILSERTRRWIRRNTKDAVDVSHESGFVQFICAFWRWVYFVLSLIFKITLGIMAAIVWACLYLCTLMIEIYCVILAVHIMTVLMKQNLPR